MDFRWFSFLLLGDNQRLSTKEVDRLCLQKQEGVVCSAAAWDTPRRILVLLSSGSSYSDYSHMCTSHFTLSSDVM